MKLTNTQEAMKEWVDEMIVAKKLSSTQEEMIEWIYEMVIEDGDEYAYCECDEHDCKPWRSTTVFALIRKGLIKLVEGGDMTRSPGGVYFLTLNKDPKQVIREDKLKMILD